MLILYLVLNLAFAIKALEQEILDLMKKSNIIVIMGCIVTKLLLW